MRKNLRLLMLLAILGGLFQRANAQSIGITASFGGATFRMDDMKYLLNYILETYPLEGAIISSFPPYIRGSAGILKKVYTNIRLGAGYSFTSTGARANYTDYSGNISTNMTAVSHLLGASINYTFAKTDHLDLSLFGKLDANFTSMDILSSVYVLGLSSTIENKYKSISPAVSAGLEFLYTFKDAAIGIEGGYLADMPQKLSNKESGSDLLDPDDSQNTLTADWSGWRLGIKGIVWLDR